MSGEALLQLPAKTEVYLPVSLSATEVDLYKRVHAEMAAKWAVLRARGHNYINQHLLGLMSMLQPLKRICSGGVLLPGDISVPDPDSAHRDKDGNGANYLVPDASLVAPAEACPICLDPLDTPVVTPCQHWLCRDCALGVLEVKALCPMCRQPVTSLQLRAGVVSQPGGASGSGAGVWGGAWKGGGGQGGGPPG